MCWEKMLAFSYPEYCDERVKEVKAEIDKTFQGLVDRALNMPPNYRNRKPSLSTPCGLKLTTPKSLLRGAPTEASSSWGSRSDIDSLNAFLQARGRHAGHY